MLMRVTIGKYIVGICMYVLVLVFVSKNRMMWSSNPSQEQKQDQHGMHVFFLKKCRYTFLQKAREEMAAKTAIDITMYQPL